MLEKIQTIFRQVFKDPLLVISEHSSADTIAMWDSLTHIELIATVEDAFQIKFTFQEVMKFNTVGDMIQMISQKVNSAY